MNVMGIMVELMRIFIVRYIYVSEILILFKIIVRIFMRYLNLRILDFEIFNICLLVVLGFMYVW